MNAFKEIILVFIAGLTEFLPVSSSAHVVLFKKFFGLRESMPGLELAAFGGMLFAVFVYFAKDIVCMLCEGVLFIFRGLRAPKRDAFFEAHPHALTLGLLFLASVPGAVLGALFQDAFEALFGSLPLIAVGWLVMGGALMASRGFASETRTAYEMNHQDAFVIGLAQGLGMIPGISRFGLAVLAGMFLGIEKKEAARFSFLLSIPAVFLAGFLRLKDGADILYPHIPFLVFAFLAASAGGYLAISFLMRFLERRNFYVFGFYCLAVGLLTLLVTVLTSLIHPLQ